VEEVSRLFGIHKNTVRNWLRQGLAPIDVQRPTVIRGDDGDKLIAIYLRDGALVHKAGRRDLQRLVARLPAFTARRCGDAV